MFTFQILNGKKSNYFLLLDSMKIITLVNYWREINPEFDNIVLLCYIRKQNLFY